MSDDAHCPVCGYYCLGKGGLGCIDKPSLVNQKLVPSAFNDNIPTIPDTISKTDEVTRFEVIDNVAGRIVVRYGVEVELSYQDGGKTLKVFLKEACDE